MPGMKVVIGTKSGKCLQQEVSEEDAPQWFGKKLGHTVKGDLLGHEGYEFVITGGSDTCGFPMRKDVKGAGRKKIFAVSGVGLKKTRKGMRRRKTVCGNTISEVTSQVNLRVEKEGKKPLFEEKKEEAQAENQPKSEDKKE